MRASGKDIAEIFGYRSDDTSAVAKRATSVRNCPFTRQACVKTNHNKSIVYGVCSVSLGANSVASEDVIICPNRLYTNSYSTLKKVADQVWGTDEISFIAGGDLSTLKDKMGLATSEWIVVAFGKGSGKEVQIKTNITMSMDWVLQRYRKQGSSWTPEDFVGIEVQSIDTTGNYRDNHAAYIEVRERSYTPTVIPNSEHGLNWANVHKRLIPQIIRKGNIYRESSRCVGFYFIVPEIVYQRFEDTLGNLSKETMPDRQHLSVHTYSLGSEGASGTSRDLNLIRTIHYTLDDVIAAFSNNQSGNAHDELDRALREIL